MKKTAAVLFVLAVFIISGCSGGSDSAGDNTSNRYVQGDIIKVDKGDKLIPKSSDAKIIIRHTFNNGEKEVEVLQGEISLLKGDYTDKNS